MFFNLFAPSTVGGRSHGFTILPGMEKRVREGLELSPRFRQLWSVFMYRALGMAVLVWLGAAGLALFPYYAVPSAIRSLTFALSLALIAGGLLVPLLRRILPDDGHPIVVKLRLAMRAYRDHWGVIPQAILLSLVLHLVQSWIHLLMGRALQINVPFLLYHPVPACQDLRRTPVSLNGSDCEKDTFLARSYRDQCREGHRLLGCLFRLLVDSLLGGVIFLVKKSPKPADDALLKSISSGSRGI